MFKNYSEKDRKSRDFNTQYISNFMIWNQDENWSRHNKTAVNLNTSVRDMNWRIKPEEKEFVLETKE